MSRSSSIWIFLFFSVSVFGQSLEHNLHKYWAYRERLKDLFIVTTPDTHLRGTNIPAVNRHINLTNVNFDDGHLSMQWYLGLLATEYKLLKDNDLDYTQTLLELEWAVSSLERLDRHGEDNDIYNSEGIENGFIARDDVDESLVELVDYRGVAPFSKVKPNCFRDRNSHVTSVFCNASEDRFSSQDNIWHYLVHLYVVFKLVELKLQF